VTGLIQAAADLQAYCEGAGGSAPAPNSLRSPNSRNRPSWRPILLVAAGIMQAGEGLQPSSRGARVRLSGTNRTVIDGPFAETTELVAGFWIWSVKSLEEAIEWVKRCPNPMMSDSDIEIRPIFEAEDFGEAFTPELGERKAKLRAEIASKSWSGV
jgi:hypothetical protein